MKVSFSRRLRSEVASHHDPPIGLTHGNLPDPIPKRNLNILSMLSKRLQPTPNLLPLLCPQRLRSLYQVDGLERRTRERRNGMECLRY